MNEDKSISESPPRPSGPFSSRRAWLLLSFLALVVFTAGLLLGRSQLGASESGLAHNAASPSPTLETSERKAAANQARLSPEAIKLGKLEFEEVSLRPFHQRLEVNGRLSVNEDATARVGTIVTGRVTRVLATVGDFVTKGQALIYIHSHELIDARAAVAKAQVSVSEKEKALAYARAELERADRLLAAKALSNREQARAAATVASAWGELEQARAELTRASEFLEHLTVPHDSRDDIVVYAPIAGVVLKRDVTLGAVVSEATDLVLIANLQSLWAIAEAPQQQAASIRVGQAIELTVSTFGDKRFPGRIVHIGEALNPETRTAQVRCLINNPRGDLRPEMYGMISVVTEGKQEALSIPSESLIEMQGEKVVFVALGDGLFEKRPVQIGRRQNGMMEVTGGLRQGELVVTRGGFFIKSEFLKSSLSEE